METSFNLSGNWERDSPAEITKFCLLNFYVISNKCHQYKTKLDKKILQSKTEAVVWR